MPSPKVTVIIPVYNVEDYLEECLESAIAQTLEDIEIIVMDDGSTDSSPQIIDRFANRDARIKAVHKANEGYGKSCNRGFDMAQGEYVAILESDDFIDPEMYERLYALAKELDADVVKGPYRDFYSDGTSKPYILNDWLSEKMPVRQLYSLVSCPWQLAYHQSIWAGIYRRSYMDEHNIRFLEAPGAGNVDVGFCVESLMHSERIAWLDEVFYNYRVLREGSSTAGYNIPLNITRYQGVHELLKSRPDIRKAAGPCLVGREIGGLLRHFKRAKFDEKDLLDMQALLREYTISEIKQAPAINEDMRTDALVLWEDIDAFKRRLEEKKAKAAAKAKGKKPSLARRIARKLLGK